MPEPSDTIASFSKNSQEEYRFSITAFKGREYADIRIFYEKDGEYLPSKKGITVALDAWSQFRESVQKLETALIERDLIKPGEQEEG
ncbi:MAG: transcriptional coactivator p15/PC4 family protein [Candidatus Latescibacteria bacterium]|nr:transcriptional coactivator p15/PC4 family protein [Candidatus Latescibacterota bacterium]